MKRDDFSLQLDLGHELIIDNFAGGGGTSTGLEEAFGRPVDIAINHDPEALAMHAINHPHTKHLCESVWDVDPIKVTKNQPVALVWLSPDCKHFSKAKGGTPVNKNIRGLAWVTLRWVAKCKPRVIMLENVEEFKTWGPLIVDSEGNWRPDPTKRGKTFESFVRQLRGHGYEVEWRELRASDYDTPTIRKRFFLVARRDGLPIRWPDPTNGAPTSPAVMAGKLAPWRTAAECIDWSIPCPSIFERKKPLAPATLRRIAKGIMRYVVDAEKPFIVGQGGPIYTGKPVPVDQPFGTLTTENHRAIVVPSIVPVTHQGSIRSESVHEPFRTVTGAQRGEKALAVATMVQTGYGERDGQTPRALDIQKPLGTVVAGASKAALVTSFLAKHYTGVVGSDLDDPIGTVTATDHHSLVAAHIQPYYSDKRPSDSRGHLPDEPVKTITTENRHALMTSSLVKLRGTSSTAGIDEPLHTVSAGGQHHAEVRAFLLSYYGSETDADSPRDPLRTVTSRERFGLVTIQGVDYQIVDIGLRMLDPAELYRAQGFPDDYVIREIPDPDLLFKDHVQSVDDPLSLPRIPLTKSAQVRMCGNSVCPPMARALIKANFAHEQQFARVA